MKLTQLETPALILDYDLMKKNMTLMDFYLEKGSAKLRPHFKSHKCVSIAKLQMQAGAKGITCAKLGEAEVLVKAGIPDILIANQIVQPSKIAALAYLALQSKLTVCADDASNLHQLSLAANAAGSTIHIYVEFEVGMRRCGVKTFPEVLALARLANSLPGLSFDGIQAYAGNLSHEDHPDKRKACVEEIEKKLRQLKEYLEENQITVKEISGGSSATAQWKAKGGVYTELQAGSYLFMDTSYGICFLPYKPSVSVLSTIISSNSEYSVADVGVKNLAMDQRLPVLKEEPFCPLTFSEEHTALGRIPALPRGSQVSFYPGHCCSTINTFDWIYLKKGDEVVDRFAIEGRGRSW